MTIKETKDLKGDELDIATAFALGFEAKTSSLGTLYWSCDKFDRSYCYNGSISRYNPSTKWIQAGDFIDWFGIEFKWISDATIETYSYTLKEKYAHGASHLEAACRLLVVNNFGETVFIPDELLEAYHGKNSS